MILSIVSLNKYLHEYLIVVEKTCEHEILIRGAPPNTARFEFAIMTLKSH
jgi:hypothetical protein